MVVYEFSKGITPKARRMLETVRVNGRGIRVIGEVKPLPQRGLDSDREVTGAGRYLSYLVAGSPALRAATIQALTRWNQGRLREAVGFVRPELDDDEARVLDSHLG